MRDPERIPLILGAVERRWREDPDLRLGQLLVNLTRDLGSAPNPLFAISDGDLLRRLGPETDGERRYISNEPAAALEAGANGSHGGAATSDDVDSPMRRPSSRRASLTELREMLSGAERETMPSGPRRITLRRPDRCASCHLELRAGEVAMWDSERREARCIGCDATPASVPPPPVLLQSTPGASTRREYDRRRTRRDERVRARLGPLAGVALAIAGEPAHQRAWDTGSVGEVKLAEKLERWTADAGVMLLHDRQVPGSRANIDHIAVGPAGVFVIDAKRYKGRIAVERRGGLFSERTELLLVRGSDRSKLVDGVLRQVEVVRAALGEHAAVDVRGVLCFVDGDWPVFGTLEIRGVPVLPPRKAARLCAAPGAMAANDVRAVALTLAAALRPAA
jgi:hypothetical protein